MLSGASSLLASVCFAAEKPRIQVNDYIIHVAVTPQTHQLKAQARVKFTALEDINIATFELHNALRPTRVDRRQRPDAPVERVSQDSTVRISLPATLTKGSSDTLIFEYEGAIQSARRQPGAGTEAGLHRRSDHLSAVRRALVSHGRLRHQPLHFHHQRERARGLHGDRQRQDERRGPGRSRRRPPASRKGSAGRRSTHLATPRGGQTVTFTYQDQPSFPGTIIIGKYVQTKSSEGGLSINVYTTPEHKSCATQLRRHRDQGVFLLHHALRSAVQPEPERGRAAERHRAFGLGAGDRRHGRPQFHREGQLPPAGQHASRISGSEPWSARPPRTTGG